MKKRWILWTFLFLIFVAVLATVGYLRADSSWQERYRQRVSDGLVELLQTNPYDQIAVVVIVIDGLRWEEGIGAQDRYIPHIWNDLRPQGTLLTNYEIVSPTATTSVHSAMLTGRISTVPNDGHIRPVFPTFMEYFRDARSDYVQEAISGLTNVPPGIFRPNEQTISEIDGLIGDAREFPPEKTALYLGKDLIYSLDQSSCAIYPEDDVFLTDSMRDIEVAEYFEAKIPDVRPDMVFVNLGDVDECAHEAQWHYYADAIRWSDRLVWEMWLALQAQTRYRDRTYFIITTDHGRHNPSRGGFPHHGCFCDGCRHSFMLIIGPGIRQGYVSDESHSELDLAPTIGRAVGFATPGSVGEPILEAFENPEGLPESRMTDSMRRVETLSVNVERGNNARRLLDSVASGGLPPGKNVTAALAMLAVDARLRNHPEEADEWSRLLYDVVPDDYTVQAPADLVIAYPMHLLHESAPADVLGLQPGDEPELQMLSDAVNQGLITANHASAPAGMSITETALIAPLFAAYGSDSNQPEMTRIAFSLLLGTLAEYEGEEKVYEGDLEDFIDDYRYREGPNVLFTEKDLPMRDRMWLCWSAERVLAEANAEHVPDLYPLLRRQYRLMVAFTHEWQDANAIVGGSGEFDDQVDFVSQGLSLAYLADFQPWRRWELDELGYSMDIYSTPLFSWPPQHLFYLLGQANALAGGWAANERMACFVRFDACLALSLDANAEVLRPPEPSYAEPALALAYGLSRFENADYNLFDLEIYPIVHQQDAQ